MFLIWKWLNNCPSTLQIFIAVVQVLPVLFFPLYFKCFDINLNCRAKKFCTVYSSWLPRIHWNYIGKRKQLKHSILTVRIFTVQCGYQSKFLMEENYHSILSRF